ncbi:EAL domain-containing protein [Cohaesibacter celericrescens]|uniref:Diguanylate cyclase n=1 Tax=Cohaesibacter celericrescens TaxID=2067669 RepID=A0A2N5XX28_9HYPH|nr:EAL domain-containing protein [Cohaesibacter celericrescens]PLW79052.1 diguanylate cyclase [Cohaesibacter celericrescens]
MLFDQLKVRYKIRLPIWILAAFIFVTAVYSLHTFKTTLESGHIAKVKALVETSLSIAQDNYNLYKQGLLTEADAQNRARDAIRAMQFDGGARVFAFDTKGIRVVSNQLYKEGTSAWKAKQTKSMIKLALEGGGLTYYNGARTLNNVVTRRVPKVAWSEHFAPWGWVVASAVYLDDVTAAVWNKLITLIVFLGGGAVVVLMIANTMARTITVPLSQLTDSMKKLAAGDTTVTISGTARGDEIGEMASAMQTFVSHETQRLALQKQLTDLAYTDSLTGLPNRTVFYESLPTEINAARQNDSICALMILDLDRFKSVNDSLGHSAGDTLLVEFSNRITTLIGPQGKFGRLSGDEFFIILFNLQNRTEADNIATSVSDVTKQPFTLEGIPVQMSSSIGLAVGPDDSTSDADLYRFASLALYEAKQAGGACICHYQPEMNQKMEKRFELETMINDALLCNQFKAHFQAKIDLVSRQIIGAEALCRWHHPEKGTINPIDFIPTAEETGHIIKIGDLMLKQACQFAVECNSWTQEPFVVAVNVSPKQLFYGRFLSSLGQCLEETGCKASWIELEITESVLINDSDEIITLLETIAALGVMITIDDFGTGYSAMSYLHRFPIKCLKIDQSFVRDMRADPQKQILVTAMLAMAHGLGLKTVAEGVEYEDVADTLTELKCDIGQGYLWHRPSPAEQLLGKIRTEKAA